MALHARAVRAVFAGLPAKGATMTAAALTERDGSGHAALPLGAPPVGRMEAAYARPNPVALARFGRAELLHAIVPFVALSAAALRLR
jgi:hypothetical protein